MAKFEIYEVTQENGRKTYEGFRRNTILPSGTQLEKLCSGDTISECETKLKNLSSPMKCVHSFDYGL